MGLLDSHPQPSIGPVSLSSLEADVLSSLYRSHPNYWVKRQLKAHLWSKQQSILNSVRDHRRTAVKSCHSAGKSFTMAALALWWIDSNPPGEAFVVTTAPTGPQVRAILWREINRLHARGKLSGRMNQTELWMTMPEGHEEMVAFGRKPADMDTAAFQGIHARRVLVIGDEAAGLHKDLLDQADSLISNELSRIVLVGNPDDPQSHFAKVCEPGSGWNVIRISAFDTPNFTGEAIPDDLKDVLISPVWVQEKKKSWGETNPLYIAKILGEFPEITNDGLIPISWIKAAQDRHLSPKLPIELGVDVGGGRDKNIIALRKGPWVRIVHRSQTSNTMITLGHVLMTMRDEEASLCKIDYIGIGKGAVDRANEMKGDQTLDNDTDQLTSNQTWLDLLLDKLKLKYLARLICGINVGRSARDKEQFVNLRAEGYWNLRLRFERGDIDIDPNDDDLAAQLVDLKWKPVSGRIQIESKEEIRKRGKSSPDSADAIMLSFLDNTEDEKEYSLSW